MALERFNRSTIYGSVSITGASFFQLILLSLLLACTVVQARPIEPSSKSLMDAYQLDSLMKSGKDWLLLDVRPRIYYILGHIPKAHNIWRPAYEADEWEYPIKGMRASQHKMEQVLSRFSATPDTLIILYDDHDNADSARLWWILQLYGHKNVALLDGGFMAWKKAGFHNSLKAPTSSKKKQYHFNEKSAAPEILADLNNVKSVLTNKNIVILDVRTKAETIGQQRKSGAFRKGRIPHSKWLEYRETIGDNGFLPKDRLLQLFNEKGIKPEHSIIVYCQSGVRSANTLFVLKELLNYPDVRNYDGSWIEWSSIKELPVTKGPIK